MEIKNSSGSLLSSKLIKMSSLVEKLDEVRLRERTRIRNEAAIEIKWWGNRIITDTDQAFNDGRLIELPDEHTEGGSGFRLIGRLRGGEESRYLAPEAKELLYLVTRVWMDDIRGWRMKTDNILLSVTSLYRSAADQKKLIDEGANAAEISSHQAGMAFDIDPRAYYFGTDRRPVCKGMNNYNQEYIEVLIHVLDGLAYYNFCNVVFEYGYDIKNEKIEERTACYHVCVSPNFI